MNTPNPIHASAVDPEGKKLNGSPEAGSPAGVPAPENQIPGPLAPFPGLDFSKPVRCKGPKYPVRIIAIDYSLTRPIIGVMQEAGTSRFEREISSWYANGQYNPTDTSRNPDFLDLENYTPATLNHGGAAAGIERD